MEQPANSPESSHPGGTSASEHKEEERRTPFSDSYIDECRLTGVQELIKRFGQPGRKFESVVFNAFMWQPQTYFGFLVELIHDPIPQTLLNFLHEGNWDEIFLYLKNIPNQSHSF